MEFALLNPLEVERVKCRTMLECGLSPKEVAGRLERSVQWVYKWRNTPFGQMHDAPRSGRPRSCITPQVTRLIRRSLGKVDHGPAVLSRQIFKRFKLKVCPASVRRELVRLGAKSYIRGVTAVLSKKNIADRRRFAALSSYGGLSKEEWRNRLVCSDESLFPLFEGRPHSRCRHVWALSRDDVPPVRKPGQQKRFMMLVMLSSWGVEYKWLTVGVKQSSKSYIRELKIMFKRLKARKRRKKGVLKSKFLKDPTDWLFLQDNAPSHLAKKTQAYLTTAVPDFINTKEWPGNSQDLNPVENFLGYAKSKMYTGHGFVKPKAMKDAARRVIAKIPESYFRKLMESMHKRCQLLRANPGKHAEY